MAAAGPGISGTETEKGWDLSYESSRWCQNELKALIRDQ